jgi:excisionase family DNA binding protein
MTDQDIGDGVHRVDFESMLKEDMARQRVLPHQKLLLTVKEAGEVLSIGRSKMYDLLGSGAIPSVCIGRSRRVRISDLETFVKGGGCEY